MLGYFVILTWTTGSLTCVRDLFARVYTRETSVYSLIQRTFVESAQNSTPEKSQDGSKSLARNGHPSIWWPRSIVLNFGFRDAAQRSVSPSEGVSTAASSHSERRQILLHWKRCRAWRAPILSRQMWFTDCDLWSRVLLKLQHPTPSPGSLSDRMRWLDMKTLTY